MMFAVAGEELGLLGSEYWAEHPTVPLASVIANLNLDMVGRAGNGKLQVLGAGTSPDFASWMKAASEESGLDLTVSTTGGALGVQVVGLDGHRHDASGPSVEMDVSLALERQSHVLHHLTGAQLEDEEVLLTSNLSDEIDTDLPTAISALASRQAALQASLQLSAQIFSVSLLDYL